MTQHLLTSTLPAAIAAIGSIIASFITARARRKLNMIDEKVKTVHEDVTTAAENAETAAQKVEHVEEIVNGGPLPKKIKP